jgi:hypothetical protein
MIRTIRELLHRRIHHTIPLGPRCIDSKNGETMAARGKANRRTQHFAARLRVLLHAIDPIPPCGQRTAMLPVQTANCGPAKKVSYRCHRTLIERGREPLVLMPLQ